MAVVRTRSSIFDNIPAADPPIGELSNLLNPPSLASAIIHVNSIALIWLVVTVVCRFWVRARITRNIDWDDWTCGLATIASIIHSALIIYDTNLKLGVHLWNIPASVFLDPANIRLLISPSLVYPITIYFVKISTLLLYRRVFGINGALTRIIRIGIIFLTAFYISYLCVQIATVTQCTSLNAATQFPVCRNAYAVNIFQSSLNVLTDFFVLLLPIRYLWSLKVTSKQKIGLFMIFGAGLITCLISVARLILLAMTLQLNDPWNSGLVSILSVVEINVGIIIASAPILSHLFRRRLKNPDITLSPSHSSSPETPRPPPPSKETSFQPPAPPSSRVENYSRPTTPVLWVSPALARAVSPDRDRYVELEDHYSPVSPVNSGRIELPGHPREVYYEVDAVPARGLTTIEMDTVIAEALVE